MLYPKPSLAKMTLYQLELLKKVWSVRDRISDAVLMGESRIYRSEL